MNWTATELEVLRQNWSRGSLAVSELLPGRTVSAIRCMAHELGLKSRNLWTPAEMKTLSQYRTLAKEELMALLPGRTWRTITAKASELGHSATANYWTNREVETLRRLYGKASTREVYAALPRHSQRAVRWRANALGLSRNYHRWTPSDVAEVKKLKSNGFLYRQIGERFGVSPDAIGMIIRRGAK